MDIDLVDIALSIIILEMAIILGAVAVKFLLGGCG